VDALDIGIIRTMGIQPYGRVPKQPKSLAPAYIAKVLKVSPETVRQRIATMQKLGVIRHFEVFPNFQHLGLQLSQYYIRLPAESGVQALVKKLESFEGLIGLYNFASPMVAVVVAYRSAGDLERKLRLLVNLAGEGELVKLNDVPMPLLRRPLSNLDWRILRALRGQALRPLSQVAREFKVSARTIKRRFERMAEEGSFFAMPIIDPDPVPGIILFELLFQFSPEAGPETLGAVHRALSSNFVCFDELVGGDVGHISVGLYTTALGDVEKLRRRGEGIRGVSRVQALVLQGSEEHFDWIDEAIDAKISQTAGGTTGEFRI
jgi:DNA-binding Lrp family transcriptional regulator